MPQWQVLTCLNISWESQRLIPRALLEVFLYLCLAVPNSYESTVWKEAAVLSSSPNLLPRQTRLLGFTFLWSSSVAGCFQMSCLLSVDPDLFEGRLSKVSPHTFLCISPSLSLLLKVRSFEEVGFAQDSPNRCNCRAKQ